LNTVRASLWVRPVISSRVGIFSIEPTFKRLILPSMKARGFFLAAEGEVVDPGCCGHGWCAFRNRCQGRWQSACQIKGPKHSVTYDCATDNPAEQHFADAPHAP